MCRRRELKAIALRAGRHNPSTFSALSHCVFGSLYWACLNDLPRRLRLEHCGLFCKRIDALSRFCRSNLAAGKAIENQPTPSPPATYPSSGNVGTSVRYRRTSCGSIIDSKTGLEWYVGPDANLTLAAARSWVRNLDACGKQWAVPTTVELRSLFDKEFVAGTGYFTSGRYWPAHIEPIFSAIGQGSWVWAQGELNGGNAPGFQFQSGRCGSSVGESFLRDSSSVRSGPVKTNRRSIPPTSRSGRMGW